MSNFWREIFKLHGTTLSTSSSYHLQFDGQTEVVNHCLEDYLHCFITDQPKNWVQYLHWAEWSYNSSWHSSIKQTPFKAFYDLSAPSLLDYILCSLDVASVDAFLTNRDHIIAQLHANLKRAQQRMKTQVDLHRTDTQFQFGDWAFVKLQPYRQSSAAHRQSNKLSNRYFGPFKVLAHIGQAACKLDLPSKA